MSKIRPKIKVKDKVKVLIGMLYKVCHQEEPNVRAPGRQAHTINVRLTHRHESLRRDHRLSKLDVTNQHQRRTSQKLTIHRI